MSASAKKLAAKFLEAARNNPSDRPEICRRAAYTFMGLAQDPKNVRSSGELAQIGMQFAGSAHRDRPPVMDDFTDLLRETAGAYHEVGDEPMELIARRREIHDERTPIDPGRVSIAPESFNRDATLGRSAVIKFAPTPFEITQGIQQSQNVAFWQGVKKEAQAMTIDVSLGFLPPLPTDFGDNPNSLSNRPYGEVEYGSDGNRTKVQFDLSLGTRCVVAGNYIAVTVGMDPPETRPNGTFFPSSQITAGASIGAFAAPSQAPLIRTVYIDHLSPLTMSKVVQIPQRAVQLLPIQADFFAGAKAELSFFNYGGHQVATALYEQSYTSWMQPIPIAGDVAFVSVFNHAVGTSGFRLPFQLAM